MERGLSDDQYDHFWQNVHFHALYCTISERTHVYVSTLVFWASGTPTHGVESHG